MITLKGDCNIHLYSQAVQADKQREKCNRQTEEQKFVMSLLILLRFSYHNSGNIFAGSSYRIIIVLCRTCIHGLTVTVAIGSFIDVLRRKIHIT